MRGLIWDSCIANPFKKERIGKEMNVFMAPEALAEVITKHRVKTLSN